MLLRLGGRCPLQEVFRTALWHISNRSRHLIWPQALGLMLPTLTGLLIGLAKDTAILSIISVKELAYFTKQVVSRTYMPFEVWAGVALVYWMCLSLLELVLRALEHRVSRYRRV